MHIPRQSDGSGAVRPDRAGALRARRRHLVGQLRSVAYWQRLVQARTDLAVAALLYAAPVPGAVVPPCWSPAPGGEHSDPAGLTSPPDGVDVDRLLGGAGAEGPGAHLDRLREVTVVLVGLSRGLQEELDVVTTALHEQLSRDGAEAPATPPGTVDRADDRADDHAALT